MVVVLAMANRLLTDVVKYTVKTVNLILHSAHSADYIKRWIIVGVSLSEQCPQITQLVMHVANSCPVVIISYIAPELSVNFVRVALEKLEILTFKPFAYASSHAHSHFCAIVCSIRRDPQQ